MAGKLSGNVIIDGTISSSKVVSSINSTPTILKVSSIVYPLNANSTSTVGGGTIQLIGSGFNANTNVYVNFELASSIVVANSNSLTFSAPANDEGVYFLQLRNTDDGTITVAPGIMYAAYTFQGTASGYSSGGTTAPGDRLNIIEKFPFASDANATDVGDLTQARRSLAGQSSDVSGYTSGGSTPSVNSNIIDKFPFASDANATDVGDLTQTRTGPTGQSSSAHGYSSCGAIPGSIATDTIDKFSFTSNANATDVGDATQARDNPTGQSSNAHGYISGGRVNFPTILNVIEKFPFASDANATDVGDLTQARTGSAAGQSSTTSGYTSGGYRNPPPGVVNTIDKFPFAADANATDVGNLTSSRLGPAGQSSTASGYSSGGTGNPPLAVGIRNIIDKFPFASDANASDVGDLTQTRYAAAGQQV